MNDIRAKYPWVGGEISGFGGGYEDACRRMFYAGMTWLDANPKADLKAHTYENIYGVFVPDSDDAKALENAVVDAERDCTGAMHQAVMSRLFFIAKNGWNAYVERIRQ